ncbi:MAG: HAD hydrolase family protein [Clostridiales bacterium]|nr:HAD hydrolase family protein [Clostridiales bacterium]
MPSILNLFESSEKEAEEIFVLCKDKEQRDKLIKAFSENAGIQLSTLDETFLEITNAGTDKGAAFKFLCGYLNIPLKSSLAFGDNNNDVSLLRAAGVSVAMGNAAENLKNEADFITLFNENNGIAAVLNAL